MTNAARCWEMETRTCPTVDPCKGPCARFESDDPAPWTGRTLEISAHLYGKIGDHLRTFGPALVHIPEGFESHTVALTASDSSSIWMRVTLTGLHPLRDEWVSLLVALDDPSGWSFGRRPAYLYDRPYDVPTHTAFHTDHVHATVSIRRHA